MDVYTSWLKKRAFKSNQNKGEFNRIPFLWPCLFLDAWGGVWNEDSYVRIPPLNTLLASSKLYLSKPMVIPFCIITIMIFFLSSHVLLLFAHNHLQQKFPSCLYVFYEKHPALFWCKLQFCSTCLKTHLHLLENVVNSEFMKSKSPPNLSIMDPHHLICVQKCKC